MTGASVWTFAYAPDTPNSIFYTGAVAVGSAAPSVNTIFDSSGYSLFSNIQERLQYLTAANFSSNVLTVNYAKGAVVVLPSGAGITINSNYTLNVLGLPSTDNSRTYALSVINNAGFDYIATSLTISGVAATTFYNGGNVALPSLVGNGPIVQSFAMINISGSVYFALTNVSVYAS